MRLDEYAQYDGLGLAELVAKKAVRPKELAELALAAITRVNPVVNAVVETYADRIEGLDENSLGHGPFRGVPFLIKDVFGHEKGRTIEFGSRLCRGMVVEEDTDYFKLVRAAGFNVLGRTATPEYSMAGTTESALYGNTSTPWREGYSAGGSTGGGTAAVMAGMVPIAHGTDIAGSIRIPASFCGSIGLKPSRGRISYGPMVDENGYGLGQNFAQTRTVRDTAALLDCLAVPQPGDPFLIPTPAESYATLAQRDPPRLRIGFSTRSPMGVATDTEVRDAVVRTAHTLAAQGHHIEEADPEFDGFAAMRDMMTLWFFGFDLRLAGYSKRSGIPIGPDVLEPTIYKIYQHARTLTAADFLSAMAGLNRVRRRMGPYFSRYDVLITPTSARVAEPWGLYHLGRTDVEVSDLSKSTYAATTQFTLPHNILGTPAVSLPLALHSSGLPIGVQLAARPAQEHLLLQLARALEESMPWAERVPPLHVTRLP